MGHRSPGAGEDLVRPPAKEERGRAAVDLVEIVPGFGVEKWYGPSAALEAAAAILVRSAQPLHHAVHRDVGRGRQPHVESPPHVVVPPRTPSGSALLAKDKHIDLQGRRNSSFGNPNQPANADKSRIVARPLIE